MAAITSPEVLLEVFPYLRVLKDGTIDRVAGTQVAPPGLDPETGVLSKDIVILPQTGVSARLYRPNTAKPGTKLPLVVYLHGGAFCISSAADPCYHTSLNNLVAEANAIAVSVNYRLAPEYPLPTAYEDCWATLNWVFNGGEDRDSWVKDHVDFGRVFLVGDSAGANIAHHLALRIKDSDPDPKMKIAGIGMVNPYFWGKKPIGGEVGDLVRKSMVDTWWNFVCPSEKGSDDPLINPFLDGAPGLEGLACGKVLVMVAEKDILRDRGRLYYEELVKSKWGGRKELIETQGEDHDFHIFNPNCDKAKILIRDLGKFVNQD
ncbi:carboxylesterase 2 [Pyrus ussuriensis x Pyrus communis]|uniref:Carboxylesterase 2 n=1 Tax=Pyrus ussuriensis x Pyrus communis TaxID=2448454 RepID=A0A5N5GXQ8_9ROSA|nr:carboxylesterase 2 [Pyrus ussuriensis x Pyrus communis]